jgi:hypothetical protein
MSFEQQIEELRAELLVCIDDAEQAQIKAELEAIRRNLEAREAAFEARIG